MWSVVAVATASESASLGGFVTIGDDSTLEGADGR
jgi:hypothetical protein